MWADTATLPSSVRGQRSLERRRWRLLYIQVLLVGLVCAGLAVLTVPEPFAPVFLLLVLGCAAVVARPIVGVYAAVFLTMVGDTVTVSWYPFTKNLSSRESILFVSDGLSINPFEILVGVTLVSWILRMLGDPEWKFRRGELFGPVMVFGAMVVVGLGYGLSRPGHDTTVALFEARPLLYLPLVYVMITNLLTTSRQYERLFMFAIAGVTVQSLLALQYYRQLDPESRVGLESLTEHAATIHVDVLIIFVLALWMLPGCSTARRAWLSLAAVPALWSYVLSQRRAAAVALIIGILLLSVLVYQHRRRAAVLFMTAATLLGGAYLAAFWNSPGSVGFAAQAVKTVVAPGEVSAEDQSSDLYRLIEAYDIWFTIRSNEVFGVGFGHRFLRPFNLPDISFFAFYEYIPHNSILWIWMKTGVMGFVAMLYLLARTLHHGIRSVIRSRSPDLTAVLASAVCYVVMYTVFAYVDIAWDIRSTVFLAMTMAICADVSSATPLTDDESADADEELEPLS